jgi:hypothetical protein
MREKELALSSKDAARGTPETQEKPTQTTNACPRNVESEEAISYQTFQPVFTEVPHDTTRAIPSLLVSGSFA